MKFCLKFKMAIGGKGFCESAHDGFYLAFRNLGTYSVSTGVSKIFIFFSKLFVCLLSTLTGYLIITKYSGF